ncbi:S41 family peptidase, partial [Streptomyces halstedii]|uniref:S41 family peptidase n=1 Tax=Streptomyces halstedii TaxID=1944 RepID=UPI00342B80C1
MAKPLGNSLRVTAGETAPVDRVVAPTIVQALGLVLDHVRLNTFNDIRVQLEPVLGTARQDEGQPMLALKQEKVDGVVIDLRNNGGGSLQEATELTGLFIDQGPTVLVRNSDGRVDVLADEHQGAFYKGPLTVLVNRLSASASEIFAG